MLVAGGVSVSEKRSEEFRPTRTEWAFFIFGQKLLGPARSGESTVRRFYGKFYGATAREREWR